MKFCQVSGAEPSRAESRQTASQSGPARPTAQSSPSNEKITRILESLPIAELSCAESAELLTSTRRSLGLSIIPWALEPDIRQGLSQGCCGCYPEQDTRRLRHPNKCDADRASEESNLSFLHEIQALGQGPAGIACARPRPQAQIKQRG